MIVSGRLVGEPARSARPGGMPRALAGAMLAGLLVMLAGCSGPTADPAPEPGQPTATEQARELPAFTPPTYPLPDPTPTGLGVTLTEFATLPPSKTNPPVPRGDKLDRRNRINYLGELPDGSGRLFVPDLNGRLYLLRDGRPTPYLDVAARTGASFWSHRGFGSGFGFVAFHPDFGRNGRFYTVHTEARDALRTATPDLSQPAGTVVHGVLSEWTARDPAADTFDGTRREVLRLGFVGYIHGIQQIDFNPTAKPGDPDHGLLYIAVGDGAAAGKAAEAKRPSTVPQDLGQPQGKILRIDPAATGPGRKYGIPPGNPLVSRPGALGEVYASGLRDPYRFSWDPAEDHRMLLGSMGENRVESIYDVRPGDNFGWSEREGPFVVRLGESCEVYPLPATDAGKGFTYPLAAYSHRPARGVGPCDDTGHAVIGGFVYRGDALPELRGRYVFGDGVSGRVFYTEADEMRRGSALAEVHELLLFDSAGAQVSMREIAGDPAVLLAGQPRVDLRFGRDGRGELYLLSKANGKVWKITGTRLAPAR
ncbi:MAG: PQQ-dependent sugar dehydrogenase [Pseudonocardia sp.]